MLLGVDTGGTFTDFVLLAEGRICIHKRLSTPAAPEQAILAGIADLGLDPQCDDLMVIHGSTVATNAALEGKGVRTLFITNRGFKDMLTIGRQARRELYNLQPKPIAPPVPPELCLETGGRLSVDGELLEPLTELDLDAIRQAIADLEPEAVAINLLFSFVDDSGERAIESAIPSDIFSSRSSFVLPEYKEYERGMATWLNAWLGPLVNRYLTDLQNALKPTPLAIMQSSGGTIDAAQAAKRAVNLLLSGPAGGLAAAQFIGQQTGQPQLMTFDMGGTSTDVALIDDDIKLTREGKIGHYPVAVPMVDMHTIGAGGGSIAFIDEGGLLQVGPQSAGADPGPACYGQGGLEPTVTDANAVLGRLRAENFLGGALRLDIEAARSAIQCIAKPLGLSIEETAEGIISIANEHMSRALRVISVQRGYAPANFQLCCFGGAGGLHVCALAESLGMDSAVVPVYGGVLSALGMLVAPRERQLSRSQTGLLGTTGISIIQQSIAQLAEQGMAELLAEGVAAEQVQQQPSLDLRYQGQSFSLNVPWQNPAQAAEAFHQAHLQRYGHQLDAAVELVNIRLGLKAWSDRVALPELQPSPVKPQPTSRIALAGIADHVPVIERQHLNAGDSIEGPALITEQVSTTLLAPGWRLQLDQLGNLQLRR